MLTRKEHIARALLLGLVYDWIDGTYCFLSAHGAVPTSDGMLDCVTLEVVTEDERKVYFQRRNNFGHMYWDNYDRAPLREWEAPDDQP